MECRFLTTSTNDAYTNMAVDEAILRSIGKGDSPPTLRFYRWDPSAASMGIFQSLEHEVDTEAASELGVDIVRRITGGGTVFHDRDGELTYSFLAPTSEVPADIVSSFREVCGALEKGLKNLGVNARYKEVNDVEIDGRKVSGSAQTRRHGAFLQHGTILIDVDIKKMLKVLKVSEEKISDKFVSSTKKRVTSLARELGERPSIEKVEKNLSKGFVEELDLDLLDGSISDKEWKMADSLREKYLSREWISKR